MGRAGKQHIIFYAESDQVRETWRNKLDEALLSRSAGRRVDDSDVVLLTPFGSDFDHGISTLNTGTIHCSFPLSGTFFTLATILLHADGGVKATWIKLYLAARKEYG